MLFLVSDFIDDDYVDALRGANRKHDVVAVRVTDPGESACGSAGLLTLEDAGAEALERNLRTAGIDIITIDAARSVVDPLIAFLRMCEKRVRRWHVAKLFRSCLRYGSQRAAKRRAPWWRSHFESVGAGDALTSGVREGPVSATLTLAPTAPRLGDTLTLIVTAKPGVAVEIPAFGETLGRFSILDFAPRQQTPDAGDAIAVQGVVRCRRR